jgi:predicted GIY-YIG superfamily endonuclease
MGQMLLFPDPRPLVEQLGQEFFRNAPPRPGVYLMRDSSGTVLYVGKAKNLRKRLASYRVANPDRLPRRQLRLLHAVFRVELQECADESAALARESELLRTLRPRFNRAGTWPGTARYLTWRATDEALNLAVPIAVEPGWQFHGPLGMGAIWLRAALVRLLWCATHPDRGLAQMPAGWFRGSLGDVVAIPGPLAGQSALTESELWLRDLFAGRVDEFAEWIRGRTCKQALPFESAAREADLETVRLLAVAKRPPEFGGSRGPSDPPT